MSGTVNGKGRWIPDADINVPFYTFAGQGAVRNGYHLMFRGWYLVDRSGDLHGPFATKAEAQKAAG